MAVEDKTYTEYKLDNPLRSELKLNMFRTSHSGSHPPTRISTMTINQWFLLFPTAQWIRLFGSSKKIFHFFVPRSSDNTSPHASGLRVQHRLHRCFFKLVLPVAVKEELVGFLFCGLLSGNRFALCLLRSWINYQHPLLLHQRPGDKQKNLEDYQWSKVCILVLLTQMM